MFGVIKVNSKMENNFGIAKNDKEFNDQHYQEFLSRQDFANAAEYLSQFRFEDETKELQHRSMVNSLRRQASKMESDTKGMSVHERDGYAFNYAMQNNIALPEYSADGKSTNEFTVRYRNRMNRILGDKSSNLTIELNNNPNSLWQSIKSFFGSDDVESTQDAFFKSLGISSNNRGKELAALGGRLESDGSGKLKISFDRSNQNILKILGAVQDLDNDNVSLYGTDKDGKKVENTKLEQQVQDAVINPIKNSNANRQTPLHGNNIIQTQKNYIDEIMNLVSEGASYDPANRSENNAKAERGMILTGFLTTGDEAAYRDYCKGKMTKEQYGAIKEQIKTSMADVVEGAFSQAENVYFLDGSAKDDVLRAADIDKRKALEDEFREAREQQKEVVYQDAIVGGRHGTYITIPGKVSGKDYNELSGFYNPGDGKGSTKIFIPDFIQDGATEKYYANPLTRGTQEAEEMNISKYNFDTAEGQIQPLGNNKFRFKYFDKTDLTEKTRDMSKEEAETAIAEELAARDLVSKVESYLVDEDGNVHNEQAGKALALLSQDIQADVMQIYGVDDPVAMATFGESYIDKLCRILNISKNSITLN